MALTQGQSVTTPIYYMNLHMSICQHTATYCNALQHTAMHCNTLPRTAVAQNGPQSRRRVYNDRTTITCSWLIHMYNSFICVPRPYVTWLIHMCDAFKCDMKAAQLEHVVDLFICISHSYAWLDHRWRDSFIHVWCIHSCVMHSFMCDAFTWQGTCATRTCVWLIYKCDSFICATPLYAALIRMSRDSFICVTYLCDTFICVTHSYVWHIHMCDSFICVTHSYVWHIHMCDSFICVTHSYVW